MEETDHGIGLVIVVRLVLLWAAQVRKALAVELDVTVDGLYAIRHDRAVSTLVELTKNSRLDELPRQEAA